MPAERRALAARHRIRARSVSTSACSCASIAARRGQHARRVLERRESGRLRDRIDLVDQRRGGGEGPGMDVERGEVVERVREQAERAGVARDAHAAGREHVPELVVPEILREAARQPQPAPVLSAAVGLAERAQRPRERRDRRRVPLGEPRHEGVEEQVGRARRLRPARRARGLGHLALIRAGAEAPGEHRRRDRLEVGLAGHRGVQGIEPPGRRRAAAAARRARAGWRTRSARPTAPAARAGARRPARARRRPARSDADAASATSSFAWAAASERSTRTAGSGVSSAARCRNAAAAASPPAACARSAERAISRGHRLVRASPSRARDARRDGRDRGPGRSRRRAPDARRGGRRGSAAR